MISVWRSRQLNREVIHLSSNLNICSTLWFRKITLFIRFRSSNWYYLIKTGSAAAAVQTPDLWHTKQTLYQLPNGAVFIHLHINAQRLKRSLNSYAWNSYAWNKSQITCFMYFLEKPRWHTLSYKNMNLNCFKC